jgi:hypothetical protein
MHLVHASKPSVGLGGIPCFTMYRYDALIKKTQFFEALEWPSQSPHCDVVRTLNEQFMLENPQMLLM